MHTKIFIMHFFQPLLLLVSYSATLALARLSTLYEGRAKLFIPRDVPDDRIVSLNNISEAAAAGNAQIISNLSMATQGDLTIVVPVQPAARIEPLPDAQARALNDSLPSLLQQLGVEPAAIPGLVSKGVPLISEAVMNSISDQTGPPLNQTARLARRGLFDAIGNWVKDVADNIGDAVTDVVQAAKQPVTDAACAVFAGGALPAYLAAAGLLALRNSNPTPTTPDLDFYLNPVHGSISHTDGISIYYQSVLPPGFGDIAGVTIGKNIYVVNGPNTAYTKPGFYDLASLLLHEFGHTKQYQALGYSLNSFGFKYLTEFCKAGFKYEGNSLEVDANAKRSSLDTFFGYPGYCFIDIWNKRGLQASLGLPTSKTFTALGFGRYSLQLERGPLTVTWNGATCS